MPRTSKPTPTRASAHLPAGCDAETGAAVETVLGRVHVRIRRWAGESVRHELLVETPRARREHTGYHSLGPIEEITDCPIQDLLEAWMVGAEWISRIASDPETARLAARHAPDRDGAGPRGAASAPVAEVPEMPPATPAPAMRLMPKRKLGREALYALMHRHGTRYEQATGADWETERPKRIKKQMGRKVSSTALDWDALSVLVDGLREDLAGAGVDVAAEDAAYDRRRAADDQARLEARRIRQAA